MAGPTDADPIHTGSASGVAGFLSAHAGSERNPARRDDAASRAPKRADVVDHCWLLEPAGTWRRSSSRRGPSVRTSGRQTVIAWGVAAPSAVEDALRHAHLGAPSSVPSEPHAGKAGSALRILHALSASLATHRVRGTHFDGGRAHGDGVRGYPHRWKAWRASVDVQARSPLDGNEGLEADRRAPSLWGSCCTRALTTMGTNDRNGAGRSPRSEPGVSRPAGRRRGRTMERPDP